MRTLFALVMALGSLVAGGVEYPAGAPNLAGTWQGTLATTHQGARMVVHITPEKTGGWHATMYIQNADPIPIQSVLVGGSTVEINSHRGRYQGEISADGSSIRNVWIDGNPQPRHSPEPLELQRATRGTAWFLPRDPSPHATRYVTVDEDVSLEVLDWGGSGRPVVLLAGLGDTAYVYDRFAPKLTPRYHVYGITRRGFGNSSTPLSGYSADRLGDDVLAVLDALHLRKPILVGSSIGGEELSSIGSRCPQRVAGLVYLEAGYQYAYYDPKMVGDALIRTIDIDELERKLDQLRFGNVAPNPRPLIRELLNTDIPRVTESLSIWQRTLQATAPSAGATQPSAPVQEVSPIVREINAGLQRYTRIPVPVLAIFRVVPGWKQADVFERGVPSARVVRLDHASHRIFLSNETDVLREMNRFISGLPQ